MTLLPGAGAVYSGSHSPEGKNQLKISFSTKFFQIFSIVETIHSPRKYIKFTGFLTFYYMVSKNYFLEKTFSTSSAFQLFL